METVRRSGRGAGMARRLAGMLACAVLAVFAAGCDFTEAKGEAERDVRGFHAAFNAGDYAEIHAGADGRFKASVSEEELDAFLAGLRGKLGDHRSSRQTSFEVETNGDGTFAYLVYESDFERGTATEEFDWLVSDGEARLLNYHVSSEALLAN